MIRKIEMDEKNLLDNLEECRAIILIQLSSLNGRFAID